MLPLRLRTSLLASLLSTGFVLGTSPFGVAEDARPLESPPGAASAEELELRSEIETLHRRLGDLENRIAAKDPARRGDMDEKGRLQARTQRILAHLAKEKAGVWKQAHGKLRELRTEVAATLKELQDRYTRGAKLNEALAIRDAIACVLDPARKVLANPMCLRSAGEASRVMYFRVTGAASGSLYGTDVYTSDSTLAAAAVHAGVLKVGQTGIVKVTTFPSHEGFASSTRNGITSSSWSSYPGFRVEALGDEDQDLNECLASDEPKVPLGAPAPDLDALKDSPAPHTRDLPEPAGVALASLPPDARETMEHFTNTAADIRKDARNAASHMTREAVAQLAPIQDAHTRAARLDEAIEVRDLIRKLTADIDRR